MKVQYFVLLEFLLYLNLKIPRFMRVRFIAESLLKCISVRLLSIFTTQHWLASISSQK